MTATKKNPKRKRTNFRWPSMGINYLRTGPIPTTPGGWGLRNPEPKGPGQRRILFSQSRRAVAGRKLGGIMISANDPVTAFGPRPPAPRQSAAHEVRARWHAAHAAAGAPTAS